MTVLRQTLALLLLMPASAFATLKLCDIYQGQIMECSATMTIASDIPVYRNNGYRNCYIQAGKAIYCDGPATVKQFPVPGRQGYRDCDIQSGIVTACGPYSSVTRFPVDTLDDEPRQWMRWLKTSLCLIPSPLRPERCRAAPVLPDEIAFFQGR